ncbi:MAG: mevalonate kinase [Promethearchaeota archaeon]
MAKIVIAKAPGKCILMGEHAVVYGHSALTMAIEKSSLCRIEKTKHKGIIINFLDLNKRFHYKDLNQAILNIPPNFKQFAVCLEKFQERISDECNNISVCFVAAMNTFFEIGLNKQEVSYMAFTMEKIVHGTPSGIDNTICTHGNIIYFQNNEFQFITPPEEFKILISYTNVKHNTKKAIELVKKLKEKDPFLFQLLIDKIGYYTELGTYELIKGNFYELGQLMHKNHQILTELNLSHPNLDEIVKISMENEAFGAKLTGAGLGGCAITIGEKETLKKISDHLQKLNYKCFISGIDKKGVSIEYKE